MKSFVSTIAALSIALFAVGCSESAPDTGAADGDSGMADMTHDEAALAAEEGEGGHAEEEAPAEGGEEAPAGEEEAPAEGGEEAPAGEEAPTEGEKAAE